MRYYAPHPRKPGAKLNVILANFAWDRIKRPRALQ